MKFRLFTILAFLTVASLSCAPVEPAQPAPTVTVTATAPTITVTVTPTPPPPVTVTVTPTPTPTPTPTLQPNPTPTPIYLNWIYATLASMPNKMKVLMDKRNVQSMDYITTGNQTFGVSLGLGAEYTLTMPASDLVQAAFLVENTSSEPQKMALAVTRAIRHLENQENIVLEWEKGIPGAIDQFYEAYNLEAQRRGTALISVEYRDQATKYMYAWLHSYRGEISEFTQTLRLISDRLQGKGD